MNRIKNVKVGPTRIRSNERIHSSIKLTKSICSETNSIFPGIFTHKHHKTLIRLKQVTIMTTYRISVKCHFSEIRFKHIDASVDRDSKISEWYGKCHLIKQ